MKLNKSLIKKEPKFEGITLKGKYFKNTNQIRNEDFLIREGYYMAINDIINILSIPNDALDPEFKKVNNMLREDYLRNIKKLKEYSRIPSILLFRKLEEDDNSQFKLDIELLLWMNEEEKKSLKEKDKDILKKEKIELINNIKKRFS